MGMDLVIQFLEELEKYHLEALPHAIMFPKLERLLKG